MPTRSAPVCQSAPIPSQSTLDSMNFNCASVTGAPGSPLPSPSSHPASARNGTINVVQSVPGGAALNCNRVDPLPITTTGYAIPSEERDRWLILIVAPNRLD